MECNASCWVKLSLRLHVMFVFDIQFHQGSIRSLQSEFICDLETNSKNRKYKVMMSIFKVFITSRQQSYWKVMFSVCPRRVPMWPLSRCIGLYCIGTPSPTSSSLDTRHGTPPRHQTWEPLSPPPPDIRHGRPIGPSPPLVTPGGNHWRPVQTCSLEGIPSPTDTDIWWPSKHIQLPSGLFLHECFLV